MILDFEVLQTAGLTAGDLARFVEIPKPYGGVTTISRTTAFNWTRGGQPAPYAIEYAAKLLEAVSKAVEKKELPLSIETKRKERTDRLKSVLAKYM